MADNGASGYWKEVESQATKFLELADANILSEPTAKWESFETREENNCKRIDSYLYMLKGKAAFEMARGGGVNNREEALDTAIDNLKKVREIEPGNTNAYWYLSQAFITKGEILSSKGDFDGKKKNRLQAKEFLEDAVKAADTDVKAHINLLVMKPVFAEMATQAQLKTLEPEYLALTKKFDTSVLAYAALSTFYQRLGHKNLDEAIKAIEKAIELDKNNIASIVNAASLYYRRFSIYGRQTDFDKAVELAKSVLLLPEAQDKPGPYYYVNRFNRAVLYTFLANCCIERTIELNFAGNKTESEMQKLLADGEQYVHEIEQMSGTNEDPRVIKWRGMLDLAKGNTSGAVRKLYLIYERMKSADQRDPQLSYFLGKIFANTDELGAALEFFGNALSLSDRTAVDKIDDAKPESLLDCADVLLKLKYGNEALALTNYFENEYWSNDRSLILRVKAYIASGQFDKAEAELTKSKIFSTEDSNVIKLKISLIQAHIEQIQSTVNQKLAQMNLDAVLPKGVKDTESENSIQQMQKEVKNYRNAWTELVIKLLATEPNSVEESSIVSVCNNYVAEKNIAKAKDLIERCLERFPNNSTIAFYKSLLSEPDPGNVSQERVRQIEKEVMSNIKDPERRAVGFGLFYQKNNEPNLAAEEFKKVVEPLFVGKKDANMTDSQQVSLSRLFDIAIRNKDWGLAEQIVNVAQVANVDECEGKFFSARLDTEKQEYNNALAEVEECLKMRPVFSYAMLLRSTINSALGNDKMAADDAMKAASLNPLDGAIAKAFANTIYQRNVKLGKIVTPVQLGEVKSALINAIRLNPADLQLQSVYAEYISETDANSALAIRQSLQKAVPSLDNALLLGRMAMRMAGQEKSDQARRKALLEIAESSFKQAQSIDPQNNTVLSIYAEYYRETGQDEKAEKLLGESDPKLLWRYYIRTGRLNEAKAILDGVYKTKPRDKDVVTGLIRVSTMMEDREAVKKYSEELLLIEDSIENHLLQIETYLRLGLVREVEPKLQSLREKYKNEPRLSLYEAWLAIEKGRLNEAMKLVNQSLEVNQSNAVAWRLRGEINSLNGEYKQAIIDFGKSKSITDEPLTRLSLAKAYLNEGREDDAIIELKSIVDYQGVAMESYRLLEQTYQRLGKKKALEELYMEAIGKYPDMPYWYSSAAAFALSGKEYEKAEKLYKIAMNKTSNNRDENIGAFDGYLQAIMMEGKPDKVIEEAGKYVNGDFAPIAFLWMAEAKSRLGDKESAVQYCRKAIDKAENNETYLANVLKQVFFILGAEEIKKVCTEKLQQNPNSYSANYTMFNLAKLNEEHDKAIEYIDKCIKPLEPNNPLRLECIMLKTGAFQMAYNARADNSYLKKAVEEYESLLSEMPNNFNVMNNLAYVLLESNERFGDALKYAKQACDANPNNPGFLDTYAYAMYRNNKYEEAQIAAISSLKQFEARKIAVPSDVYEHLGMIKEKLQDKAGALAAYKKAAELLSGNKSAPKLSSERLNKAIERVSKN